MQEHTAMNVGMIKRQASVIEYHTEDYMWKTGVLGEDSPDKLRDTVLFLLGMNVLLHAVEEHYNLRRGTSQQDSQLSFRRNSEGVKCLVFQEDSVTKTHDGGLNDFRKDRKIVLVYPSTDVNRCPVRLVKKYLSLCPKFDRKPNFYLQSKQRTTPMQWYSCQVVGSNTIGRMVKD